MKKLNSIVIIGISVACAVACFGFANGKTNPKKPMLRKTLYYIGGGAYQKVENGYNGGSVEGRSMNMDPFYNNLGTSWFTNPNNWSDDPGFSDYAVPYMSGGDSYVWKFTIDYWEGTSNGTSTTDLAISTQEALDALEAYHVSTNTLPASLYVGYGHISDIIRSQDPH